MLTEDVEPTTVNEMTLTAVDDGTLLSLLITYPDVEIRDTILEAKVAEGMEASYARMESELMSAQ